MTINKKTIKRMMTTLSVFLILLVGACAEKPENIETVAEAPAVSSSPVPQANDCPSTTVENTASTGACPGPDIPISWD